MNNLLPFREESLSLYDFSYHQWRFKRYIELVVGKIKKTDKFLDVGCQEGILLYYLPECQKFGLEIEKKYLKLAQKRNPKGKFVVGLAEKLPFKDEFFDWVACTEVIEHINSPDHGLQQIHRVLKRDGYFLVSTYNHYNIFNLLTGRAFSKKPRLPDHVREYNWFLLKKLLSKYFLLEKYTQAGSTRFTDSLLKIIGLPFGEFIIVLARKK